VGFAFSSSNLSEKSQTVESSSVFQEAVRAVTLQEADRGDTTTLDATLSEGKFSFFVGEKIS
jgi:hypothetical protein